MEHRVAIFGFNVGVVLLVLLVLIFLAGGGDVL